MLFPIHDTVVVLTLHGRVVHPTIVLNISITELYFWSTWSFASGLVHLLLISRDCGSVQYNAGFLPLFKYSTGPLIRNTSVRN